MISKLGNPNSQSKVSMVMPFFNKTREEIDRMVQSIYDQVWNNIELIIVNDGAEKEPRAILDEWIPRFKQRGYEYIIIDQENQGISMAVRNGMLRMTGDYFCSVDCDDYLYPEYVSTMASHLDSNPECDYTACGYELVNGTEDNYFIRKNYKTMFEYLTSPYNVELVLLRKIVIVSWIYMARKRYVDTCGIIKNFVTEPRLHQEPSIVIPLMMGGGGFQYFSQVLYRHFNVGRNKDLSYLNAMIPNYIENFACVLRKVIQSFPTYDKIRREKLLSLCDFFGMKYLLSISKDFSDQEDKKLETFSELAGYINNMFIPCPEISVEAIAFTGSAPLFEALECCILNIKNKAAKVTTKRYAGGRIICYGALGKAAHTLIPQLFRMDMKPDVLWDASAMPGHAIMGISVDKPDVSSLSENDIIIIAPRVPTVADEIERLLAEAGAKHIIQNLEIGIWHYHKFYDGTYRFKFNPQTI